MGEGRGTAGILPLQKTPSPRERLGETVPAGRGLREARAIAEPRAPASMLGKLCRPAERRPARGFPRHAAHPTLP